MEGSDARVNNFMGGNIEYRPANENSGANKLPVLWGGIECSINRVQNRFQDQLELSGHYQRPGDIDLIAQTGIKILRFPILFEKHAAEKDKPIDWSWAAERLSCLAAHNITPIVGLVHHGSGPAYTDLSKRSFATGLASFAANVAKRFPHIEYYTPVNEPLTTARFSGLYGLWYPHCGDDRSFCTMLINQMMGVVLAMKEVRKINPQAKLVQTEDLSKVYTVKNLQYQADFDNARRWTTFDFLCGKVDEDHFLWQYFIDSGVTRKDLEFFLENPCPPDIIGLNYYVTSERFLDDNISAYPQHLHGGNHIEKYVDTEAVRINHGNPSGLEVLLREVEQRYNLPMAITEVHLHCTREEQMRWFKEVWQTCCHLANSGMDIRGVTAWSLFGAFGWNKLLTSPECDYEAGVFDLRAPEPRKTAMFNLLKALAENRSFEMPLLNLPGWWKRNARFHAHAGGFPEPEASYGSDDFNDVLVITGNTIISKAISAACEARGIPYRLLMTTDGLSTITHVRICGIIVTEELHNGELLTRLMNRIVSPKRVMLISSAAAAAQQHQEELLREDTYVPGIEEKILQWCADALIIRHGRIIGSGEDDISIKIIEAAQTGEKMNLCENVIHSFSFLPHLVNAALDLLIDNEKGVHHLVHAERMSLYQYGMELCMLLQLDTSCFVPYSGEASVPALEEGRISVMPPLHRVIESYAAHVPSAGAMSCLSA